ncbi:hypothetical protein [Exiguobacterium sp. s196]|uniref:phosphoribosyltransferase-like protein n=1 Tax=Exiguobacterium sp. s196 TaxID=2751283 RepID=UPI001BE59B0C|nr:hypothetical protein [Exiguobacterium sp. s196]
MEEQKMINSLVNIAKDYENCSFDKVHVTKWLDQFPESSRLAILIELNNILKYTYFSKEALINFLRMALTDKQIFKKDLQEYKFINPQTKGNSQKEMLKLINEIFEAELGLELSDCGKGEIASYVYVDDVFYSGNRLKRDIEAWVSSLGEGLSIKRLDILYIAVHERNLEYVHNKLKELLPNTEVGIFYGIKFRDSIKNSKYSFEAYLPLGNQKFNSNAVNYVSRLDALRTEPQKKYIPLFRERSVYFKDDYFTCSLNRNTVEKLFFEKGVQITEYSIAPNFNMRPMGYDYSNTLGFGSYVVTYRNIANNCPLVLWWGDPTSNFGINNWYPLFPRTTNEGII